MILTKWLCCFIQSCSFTQRLKKSVLIVDNTELFILVDFGDKFSSKGLQNLNKMTEFSKNSRKRAQTGSRIGERSKEGPTHPYSNHVSDSRSQYSVQKSNQEEVPQQADYNYQIALQYIMPLVSTIKQQNEHFKDQKKQMEQDMLLLQKLSQQLLVENQQMRKHYSARTGDIKNIIQTISINTNEEINDVNHQSFLLKESNCILVKNIEEQMRNMQQLQASLTEKQKRLHQDTQRNIILQQNNCDIVVRNKQLFQKCEKIKIQTQKLTTNNLDQSINQLLDQVVTLRNTNKTNILKAKQILNVYQQQKPALLESHDNVVRNNKQLEQQVNQLKDTLKNTSQVLQQRRQNYQKTLTDVISALKHKQKVLNKISEVDNSFIEKKGLLDQSKANSKRKQQVLDAIKNQKECLLQLIKKKKKGTKQLEEEYRNAKQIAQSNHKQSLKKLRQDLAKQQARANEQISAKIAPQSKQLKSRIQDQKQQYALLVQQVQDLSKNVSRLQNPIKQIVHLQYKLKKARALKQ